MSKVNVLMLQSAVLHVDSVKYLMKYHYNISVNFCELMQSAYHDTYLLRSGSGFYTFKIYNELTSSKQIEETCRDSFNLINSDNVKTIKCTKTVGNEYFIQIKLAEKNRLCVLWDYFRGNELLYLSRDDSFLYGKSLGFFHSMNRKGSYCKVINILDLLQKSKSIILKNYFDHDCYMSFYELFERLESILGFANFDSISRSYCHGDSHGGNVCYDGFSIGFYDIDDSGYGYCLHDIAAFKWMCIQRNDLMTWNGFLNGYLVVKTINDLENKYLDFFVIMRDLWVLSRYIENKEKTGSSIINNSSFINKRLDFSNGLIEGF